MADGSSFPSPIRLGTLFYEGRCGSLKKTFYCEGITPIFNVTFERRGLDISDIDNKNKYHQSHQYQ